MNTVKIPDDRTVAKINKLTLDEMVDLWRFAPVGHIYFDNTLPYYKIFEERFEKLVGWESWAE